MKAQWKLIEAKQEEEQPAKQYIMSIEDSWSRCVDLILIPDKTGQTVEAYLTEEFPSRFGFPGNN